MSRCVLHSCLPLTLWQSPQTPPLGPQQGLPCFGDAAGQLGSRTASPPAIPKHSCLPFFFLHRRRHHQQAWPRKSPQTEWSSVACRRRSRYPVSSSECWDDGARPLILIYCQICGVDQPGECNSRESEREREEGRRRTLTPLRHTTANVSRLICLLPPPSCLFVLEIFPCSYALIYWLRVSRDYGYLYCYSLCLLVAAWYCDNSLQCPADWNYTHIAVF